MPLDSRISGSGYFGYEACRLQGLEREKIENEYAELMKKIVGTSDCFRMSRS